MRTRRRILVAEEDSQAGQGVAGLLGQLGHDVQLAHDGHAALEAASINRPNLVLLALALPGLDGFSVARYLRLDSRLSHAPIVALSRSGREEDRRRTYAAGFDAHLVKPVHLGTLRVLISRL
jgi:CheY-like chemotaxis protein